MNEVHFDVKDISKRPTILNKSLDDLKARCAELSKIGIPITIDALTIRKTDYLKYVKKNCHEENEQHKILLLDIEIRLQNLRRTRRTKQTMN